MPLNIKDDEVHRQARQLAALTGKSLTSAVREAISERLTAVQRRQAVPVEDRKAEKLMDLARVCAAEMGKGAHSSDHAAIYGMDGLPL